MNLKKMFTEAVSGSFNKSFDAVAAELLQMLQENRNRNQQSETGNQITSMTIAPKIRIEFDNNDNFEIEVTVAGKQTRQVTGKASCSFNPNQPELNFVGGSVEGSEDGGEEPSEKPSEEQFFLALHNSDETLTGEEIDEYFASSKDWGSFAEWIAAGNADTYENVIADDECADEFVALIRAALANKD